jgi:ferredoxin-NADP reductase
VFGPLGLPYVRDESATDDIVMIAGGTGITPFRSLIKHYAENNKPNNLILIHSVRTSNDRCYADEIARICEVNSNISINYFITHEDTVNDASCIKGFIDEAHFRSILLEPEKKLYIICGPQGMISASIEILTRIGVPMERIKTESWGNQNIKAV